MSKMNKLAALISITIAALYLIASLACYFIFGIAKPISCGIALAKVNLTDTVCAEVRGSRKIFIVKPGAGDAFYTAMREKGYEYLPEEQMGSMIVFEKDGVEYRGIYDAGGYISFWSLEESLT